jgi:hypothetical protein
VLAEAAEVGPLEPDGTRRVAVAANQAESELIQGVLQSAGIPSTWRRTGGDLAALLAGGYREVYVPDEAASEAAALLATTTVPGLPAAAAERTRRVGLERSGIRLLGKATATLMLLGVATAAIASFLPGNSRLAAIALAALFAVVALIVWWSERASVGE